MIGLGDVTCSNRHSAQDLLKNAQP